MNFKYDVNDLVNLTNYLKTVDLSNHPVNEIFTELRKVDPFPQLSIRIEKGEKIYRGRTRHTDLITEIKHFSYNPLPKKIGRANLENTTCFYGCIENNRLDNDIAVIYELGHKERLKNSKINSFIKNKYAVSCWEVVEPIMVELTGFNYLGYHKYDSEYARLCKKYYNELKEYYSTEDYISVLKYFELLGSEFSKKCVKFDHEYLITACYSQISLNEKLLGGIAYPSVGVKGKVLNIALNPEVADSKLKFINAKNVEIYSYNDQSISFTTHKSKEINNGTKILYEKLNKVNKKEIKKNLETNFKYFEKLKLIYGSNSDMLEFFNNVKLEINNGRVTHVI